MYRKQPALEWKDQNHVATSYNPLIPRDCHQALKTGHEIALKEKGLSVAKLFASKLHVKALQNIGNTHRQVDQLMSKASRENILDTMSPEVS